MKPFKIIKSINEISQIDIFADTDFKTQLKGIARKCKNSMKYPSYSKPISNVNWDLLNPNVFYENKTTLDQGLEVSSTLRLSSYVYIKGEPINITASISSPKGLTTELDHIVEIRSKQKVVAEFKLQTITQTDNVVRYRSTYNIDDIISNDWDQELELVLTFQLGGNITRSISKIFQYSKKYIELKSIDNAYVENSNLVIPLNFYVEEYGFYTTSAILYSAKTNRPLAHLTNKKTLDISHQSMDLKVHANVLKDTNDEGPYILKNFSIKKSPTQPSKNSGYGTSIIKKTRVQGFPLNHYSNREWSSNQNRLDFLQRLARN